METEQTKKRGYLSNFKNYNEWFKSHDIIWQRKHLVKCKHCGKRFIPTAPNQKYCGPENPECYKQRNDPKLANGMWVKNVSAETLTSYKDKDSHNNGQ